MNIPDPLCVGLIAKGAHMGAAATWPHSSEKAARNSDYVRKLDWLVFGQAAEPCPKTAGSGPGRGTAGRHSGAAEGRHIALQNPATYR
jgi:hypothetical protein